MEQIIKDIVGFIESLIAAIETIMASIVKKPGYEDPSNLPLTDDEAATL